MFKKVLIAVDFSEAARDVLHFGTRLATELGAQMVVANVVRDPLRQPYEVELVGPDWVKLKQRWMAEAGAQLRGLLRAEGHEPGTVSEVVVMGQEANEIVELARAHSVDAIVIGTHGYGPVNHFILGSVAERVLRQADCPVVTVPYKAFARTRPSEPLPRVVG